MEDAGCCWLVAWWEAIETPFVLTILLLMCLYFAKERNLSSKQINRQHEIWAEYWLITAFVTFRAGFCWRWLFVCVYRAYSTKVNFFFFRYEHISEDWCLKIRSFSSIMRGKNSDKRNNFAPMMYINLRRPTVRYFIFFHFHVSIFVWWCGCFFLLLSLNSFQLN